MAHSSRYVSPVGSALNEDFWRGNNNTTKPDGTADTTQDIGRTGNVGAGTFVPHTMLHTAGSFATGYVQHALGTNFIATMAHHTIEVTSAAGAASGVQLPSAAGIAGREYTVKLAANNATTTITVGSASQIEDDAGTLNAGVLIAAPGLTSATWKSNGTTWQLVAKRGASSASTPADFWRTQPANTLPDGTTDTTEAIHRAGLTGLGGGTPFTPVATFDVATVARTGTDGRVAGVTPFYLTSVLPSIAPVNQPATPVGGVEFRFNNQTQGIGIAANGVYATGSNANQDLVLLTRGNGRFEIQWQLPLGNIFHEDIATPSAAAANRTFNRRYFMSGVVVSEYTGAIVDSVAPLQVRQQWSLTVNGAAVVGATLRPVNDGVRTAGAELFIDNNRINDRKLVLLDTTSTRKQFFGFGIEAGALRYSIAGAANFHRWYAGLTGTTEQLLAELAGTGQFRLPVAQAAAVPATDLPLFRDPATGNIRQGAAGSIPTANDPLFGTIGSATVPLGTRKVVVNNSGTNITLTLPNSAAAGPGARIAISRSLNSTGTITVLNSGGFSLQNLDGTFALSTTIGAHSPSGGGLSGNNTFWSDGVNTWFR